MEAIPSSGSHYMVRDIAPVRSLTAVVASSLNKSFFQCLSGELFLSTASVKDSIKVVHSTGFPEKSLPSKYSSL